LADGEWDGTDARRQHSLELALGSERRAVAKLVVQLHFEGQLVTGGQTGLDKRCLAHRGGGGRRAAGRDVQREGAAREEGARAVAVLVDPYVRLEVTRILPSGGAGSGEREGEGEEWVWRQWREGRAAGGCGGRAARASRTCGTYAIE
jgi:hypothetical protein